MKQGTAASAERRTRSASGQHLDSMRSKPAGLEVIRKRSMDGTARTTACDAKDYMKKLGPKKLAYMHSHLFIMDMLQWMAGGLKT